MRWWFITLMIATPAFAEDIVGPAAPQAPSCDCAIDMNQLRLQQLQRRVDDIYQELQRQRQEEFWRVQRDRRDRGLPTFIVR